MRVLKIVIALIVGFAATKSIFEMAVEDSGPALYGGLTAYVLIMGLCLWLFFSGISDDKKDVPKIRTQSPSSSNNIENSALWDLKEKGILTEEEYLEKIERLREKHLLETMMNSEEYKQLKNLLDSKLLTQEEFEEKIILLKNNFSR